MKTTISTTIDIDIYKLAKLHNIKLNVAFEKGVNCLLNKANEEDKDELIEKLQTNIKRLQGLVADLTTKLEQK